jgi:hypothetical protein
MITKSKIYFISSGTSKTDLGKRYKKNDLTYNGFKELINLRENKYFQDEILYNTNTAFFVSANISCVESALILFSNSKKDVVVLPYLNTERNDEKQYKQFFEVNIDKKIRGHSHYLQTLTSSFNKNQNLAMIIKDFPNIITDLKTNIKNYKKFDTQKFIELLEIFINTNPGINIVVLCDSTAVKKILIKMKRYDDVKESNIENSSIFELNVNSSPINIEYYICNKFYPTGSNFKPLKRDNNKFLYDLGGKHIPLFDKSKTKTIPYNLLIKENNSVNKSVNKSVYKPVNNNNNGIVKILNKNNNISRNKTNSQTKNIKSILNNLQPVIVS